MTKHVDDQTLREDELIYRLEIIKHDIAGLRYRRNDCNGSLAVALDNIRHLAIVIADDMQEYIRNRK